MRFGASIELTLGAVIVSNIRNAIFPVPFAPAVHSNEMATLCNSRETERRFQNVTVSLSFL
jgi:hypothetical protein